MIDHDLETYAIASLEEGAGLRRQARRCIPDVLRAAHAIAEAIEEGGKLITFGNGGSAADAQHVAAEFVGRFDTDRRSLAAVSLTTDGSALTAIGNDFGFEQVFARQLQGIGRPGDVALAVSTSGRSPNVLAGVKAARQMRIKTIGLTGDAPNPLADHSDISIVVPSRATPRVQECQFALEHVLCECVEAILFPESASGGIAARRSDVPQHGRSTEKVVTMEALVNQRDQWRRQGKVVVWTNGCFDLLHMGHLRTLEAASQLGDVLVVGLNDDTSVRAIKGAGRPMVPADERAALLAAMEVVDRVVVFGEQTPEDPLRLVQPDIHCKGEDYAPPDGKPIPELSVVEEYGGKVMFIPLVESRSTSSLIDSARAAGSPGNRS
jgi:rfaE bifunctional protein nucleotidyltransferase chain/domain